MMTAKQAKKLSEIGLFEYNQRMAEKTENCIKDLNASIRLNCKQGKTFCQRQIQYSFDKIAVSEYYNKLGFKITYPYGYICQITWSE